MASSEVKERGLAKAHKVIERMRGNKDYSDSKRVVSVNKKLKLEVNCIRAESVGNDYDGTAIAFEVYAVVNGKVVDCVSFVEYAKDEPELKYLIDCYT